MRTLDILFEGNSFHFEEVEERGYFASILDLPGCFSDGRTLDEAFANIQEALALVLDSAAEDGLEIPERYRTMAAQAS